MEHTPVFHFSVALRDAMHHRNLEALKKCIAAAEAAGLQKRLGLQLHMAKKIMEQLMRIEKLKHDILDLDQKTIAELKSYAQPPEAVHLVMAATLLLLGESDQSVKVHIFILINELRPLRRMLHVSIDQYWPSDFLVLLHPQFIYCDHPHRHTQRLQQISCSSHVTPNRLFSTCI